MQRILLFILYLTISTPSLHGSIAEQITVKRVLDVWDQSTDEAFELAQKYLEQGKRDNNQFDQIKANFILGYIEETERNKPLVGLLYYLEGVKVFEISPSEESRRDYSLMCENIGITYLAFNQPDVALDFLHKAAKSAKILGNNKQLSKILLQQVDCYSKLGLNEQSFSEMDSAIAIGELCDIETQLMTLNEVGLSALTFGHISKANNYFKALLQLCDDYQFTNQDIKSKYLFFGNNNLGMTHLQMNKLESAKSLVAKSLTILESATNIIENRYLFDAYYDMAKIYIATEELDSALLYLNKSKDFSSFQFVTEYPKRFEMFNDLTKVLLQTKKYDSAFKYKTIYDEHLQNHLRIKEAAAIENQKMNIDLVTKKYADITKGEEILQAKILWMSFGGGAIALFILLTGIALLYKRYRTKIELERQIEEIRNS
ncbi:MAG: tetratricopeptide (TPR) repeat protein [Cyclobacteriaceae bacterium]|jgi:tetratricopeptide (TPR) repeat protein